MKSLPAVPAALLAVVLITACGSAHKAAAPHKAPPAAAVAVPSTAPAVSPCATAVTNWDDISLTDAPAPASPLNSLAQAMLRLRNATSDNNQPLVEKLGKRIAKDALAVLHHDMPPGCAPGLRRAVKEQMIFAGLAGVGMQLGDFSSAATSMKRAVAYQDKAEADEDAITGSDMGGW
jgi:hypothetical protein